MRHAYIKFISFREIYKVVLFFWEISESWRLARSLINLISSHLSFPSIHQTSVFPFHRRESVATIVVDRELAVIIRLFQKPADTIPPLSVQFHSTGKTSSHAWLASNPTPYNDKVLQLIHRCVPKSRWWFRTDVQTCAHVKRFRLLENILHQRRGQTAEESENPG